MNTAPRSVELVSNPAKRSPVFAARALATASCDSPRTLIPRNGRSLSFGHVVDVFCTQKDTSGGSKETGTNVLAARPTSTPSACAAIAMTPDGKCPNASRRDAGLRWMLLMALPSSHVAACGGHVRWARGMLVELPCVSAHLQSAADGFRR